MDSLRVHLARFVEVEEALLDQRNRAAKQTASRNIFAVLAGTLVAIALGIGGMFIVARNIQRQVGGEPAEIASLAKQIAHGDLDVDTGDAERQTGILASVSAMVASLRLNKIVSSEQDWVSAGENQLNEAMRGDLSVFEVTDNVIRFLAEYLTAQVGAIYVAENSHDDANANETALILEGSYAFTLRKGMNDKIAIGQGLVGQAAASKKEISITELPDNFTRIRSATGDVVPKNIVVQPLLLDGKLLGVIELGGFSEFSPKVLEFLSGVSGAISVGINTAQGRLQIQRVLQKTTEQADTLQLQQEELAQYVARQQAITSASPDPIITIDSTGIILSASDSLETVFGYAPNEVIDKNIKMLMPERYGSKHDGYLSKYMETGVGAIIGMARELVAIRQDGEEFPCEISISQVDLPSKELPLFTGIIRDITDRKEVERKVEESNQALTMKTRILEEQKLRVEMANEELETARNEIEKKAEDLILASKYKSEFLTNMSHELRTPLNSLLILADSLSLNKKGNLTPEQVGKAEVIHAAGEDLLTLINDILDLSKVESGKLDIISGDIVVSEFVDHIKRHFGPVADQKGITLRCTLDPAIPHTFFTDGTRVEQILRNLCSNALKFTDAGTVTLRIYSPNADELSSPLNESTPGGILAFSVTDTGIGIPLDKQQAIFEAFQQADGTTVRRFGGTGLGLAISREMSRLLGGQIGIQSTEGEGSTFTLYLPELDPDSLDDMPSPRRSGNNMFARTQAKLTLDKSAATAVEHQTVEDDREDIGEDDRTVLVIDDDMRFAEILVEVAHENGFKSLVAGDGRNGLAMATKYQPDAIMLDICLPGADGLTVLDALKSGSQTCHIPVHVISVSDEERASLEGGAESFVSKPASGEALKKVFRQLESLLQDKTDECVGDTPQFSQGLDGASPPALEDDSSDGDEALAGKKILVVDDDMRNTFALSGALQERGAANVVLAGDGQQALDTLEREQDFDLIIMDLMMPVMNGYEAMTRIRQNDAYGNVPIIVLTAMVAASDLEKCIDAGASEVVTKPTKVEKIVSLAARLFKEHDVVRL